MRLHLPLSSATRIRCTLLRPTPSYSMILSIKVILPCSLVFLLFFPVDSDSQKSSPLRNCPTNPCCLLLPFLNKHLSMRGLLEISIFPLNLAVHMTLINLYRGTASLLPPLLLPYYSSVFILHIHSAMLVINSIAIFSTELSTFVQNVLGECQFLFFFFIFFS